MFTPERVRATCLDFSSPLVSIDDSAMSSFVKSLPWPAVVEQTNASTNAFPELKFASADDEAGFLTLVHALDFGSGFRRELHRRRNHQGAWLTIRHGLVEIGKLSTHVDGDFLMALQLHQVLGLFDIDGAPDLVPLGEGILAVLQERFGL